MGVVPLLAKWPARCRYSYLEAPIVAGPRVDRHAAHHNAGGSEAAYYSLHARDCLRDDCSRNSIARDSTRVSHRRSVSWKCSGEVWAAHKHYLHNGLAKRMMSTLGRLALTRQRLGYYVQMDDYRAAERVARALRYPYTAPRHSYLLAGEVAFPLPALGPSSVPDLLTPYLAPTALAMAEVDIRDGLLADRTAVLSYGANRSPVALAAKIRGCSNRVVPVLAATVSGIDVCFSAHIAKSGIAPATIIRDPRVAAQVMVAFLEKGQLQAVHASESVGANYDFLTIEDISMLFEDGSIANGICAYVGRFGVLDFGSGPIALSAIQARGRTRPSMSARGVMDEIASRISPTQDVEVLVHRLQTDPAYRAQIASMLVTNYSLPDSIGFHEDD